MNYLKLMGRKWKEANWKVKSFNYDIILKLEPFCLLRYFADRWSGTRRPLGWDLHSSSGTFPLIPVSAVPSARGQVASLLLIIIITTRKGWCPRTGRGQRLMIRIAVNEDIVLATCQDKYSKKVTPRENPKTPILAPLNGHSLSQNPSLFVNFGTKLTVTLF